MKRAAKITIGIALTLAIIAGGVVFAANSLLGDQAATHISSKIGRDVSIEGPVKIKWRWTPHINARGIRLANVAGAKDPYMVDIAEADFTIKIWKLLYGKLDIPSIELRQPKIILEKEDEDNKNWDLPFASKGNAAVNAALPSDRHDMPIIGRIRITDGQLIYRDKPRKLDLDLGINIAQGKTQKDEHFALKGTGRMMDRDFKLTAEGGSLEMLRDSRKDYPLTLAIEFGATKIAIDGTFRDPVQLKGLDSSVKMSGDNLADLFYLTGIPLPITPAYTLEGRLEKTDGVWTFEDFKGTVGGSDLSGRLVYDTDRERSLLSGTLLSDTLDVKDLGGFIGLTPKAPSKNDRLLPDVPIELARLRAADIDVDFKANRLNAPGWPLSAMDTKIKLDDGLLDLDPISFGLASGTVSGALRLNGRTDVPDVKIGLDLKNLSLKQFLKNAKFSELSEGRFGGHIDLQGRGKSLAKVLGDSDGHVAMIMAGGRISLVIVEAADLDIAQLMPLILGKKNKTTPIHCAVADFTVKSGVLNSKIFVLDTGDSNIQGTAKVDLEKETINASIDAHPKDNSPLALQSKILLSGKLKKPRILIDPVSTGIRGAAAVAAATVLTPFAAILPFIEMEKGKDSNCAKLINTAAVHVPAEAIPANALPVIGAEKPLPEGKEDRAQAE